MNWQEHLPRFRFRPIAPYGRITPRVLVVHQTTGDMDDGSDAVAYMFSRDDGIRWHWTVGADGTAWKHAEWGDMMAHALGINSISVGIEHDMPINAKPPEAMYQTSAKIAAAFCRFIGREPDRDFIIGHDEDWKYGGTSAHTDPGPDWDWAHYMELVRQEYEGEDMAFEDFKRGWQRYRDGANLPDDASGDFKWGWLQARFANMNPEPSEHEHPHTHEQRGETGREKKVF